MQQPYKFPDRTLSNDQVVIEAPETAQNNGFFSKFKKNAGIQGKTGVNPAQNKPLDISATLTKAIEDMETKRVLNNGQCVLLINKAINQPETIKHIRDLIAADPSNGAAKYSLGIQCLLERFDAGEAFALIDTCKEIASTEESLGRHFLTDKVKPIICGLNILIQKSDNTYRWANLNELKTAIPGNANLFVKIKQSAAKRAKQAKTKLVISRNQSNPYLVLGDDGEVEYLRKPFTGQLTKEEARLIREHEEAKAKAKLIEDTQKLKDKAATKDQNKLNRQLELQKQELWMASELERTELQIKQAYQSQKLASFQKPAIVLAVLAFVGLAVSQMDKLPQNAPKTFQATIPAATTYQAPAWGNE